MSSSYFEAMKLPDGWSYSKSGLAFLKDLALDGARRRAVVIIAPGPATFDGNVRRLLKHILLVSFLTLLRGLGSKVVVIGRAVRGTSTVGIAIERQLLRICNLYTARDEATREIVGNKILVLPDVAFGSKITGTSQADHTQSDERVRPFVGISLRADRDIRVSNLESLFAEVRGRGFDPIFISQVRSDAQRHRELATILSVGHVDWTTDTSHLRQEENVVAAYQNCQAIVSDRLHSLIMGALDGAIPVIVTTKFDNKLHASLDALLLPQSVSLTEADAEFTELTLDLAEKVRIAYRMDAAIRSSNRINALLATALGT